jgi:sulfatase maturation enzyme AslB (radical SAM superfamily)
MKVAELKDIVDRWIDLNDAEKVVKELNYTKGADEYFNEVVLNLGNYKAANKLLKKLERKDKKYKRGEHRLLEELPAKIEEAINKSNWSMLPDAPLSQEGRKLYRDYRQYLRDIPELWERQQIKKIEVMTFEQWLKDAPKYKIEKKVIL